MRRALICGVLAAFASLTALPAAAIEGPWCLKASMGIGFVAERCDFRTFEACRNERGSWGSSAFCVQNSRFLPYWQGSGFDQEPRRKKKYRRQ